MPSSEPRVRAETDRAARDRVFERSPQVEQLHGTERRGAVVLVDVAAPQGTTPRGPLRIECRPR
jgi:hypothetical protein